MFSSTRSRSWSRLQIKNSQSRSRPKRAGSKTLGLRMINNDLDMRGEGIEARGHDMVGKEVN